MSRIAYVNGAYLPISAATVHIEDRGNQFSDGVYEGVTVRNGKLIDLEPHITRLNRSLNEIHIQSPMSDAALMHIVREVVRRNRAKDALIYLQVSRGAAKRDHPFPKNIRPTVIITCRRLDFTAIAARIQKGVKAISLPDNRWGRCDVKSLALLPNILAKQTAREQGAFEAVLVDEDGFVTEGSSTNIWMITKNGVLVTSPTKNNILPGITRSAILTLASQIQIKYEERAFTIQEAMAGSEMFLTSSTCGAQPIIALDDTPIGTGVSGPIALRLAEEYAAYMTRH